MRQVTLMSDLHLEFSPMSLEGGDILILAGDICVANHFMDIHFERLAREYIAFFDVASRLYNTVIYIMGNHEHYHGDLSTSEDILRGRLSEFKNVHVLENATHQIGNTVFAATTLWTDMNKADFHSMYSIKKGISDFGLVRNKGRKLVPEDLIDLHNYAHGFIRRAALDNKDKEVIVVTHMGPTMNSIDPKYRAHNLTNGFFASDLSETILENQNIRYWVHGHTHTDHDYMVGDTRVICNPRGYMGHESRALTYNTNFTFDITG